MEEAVWKAIGLYLFEIIHLANWLLERYLKLRLSLYWMEWIGVSLGR